MMCGKKKERNVLKIRFSVPGGVNIRMSVRSCVYVYLMYTFYFPFLSRVITLLCYPCFRDLCRGNNVVRILGEAKNGFSTEPIALAKLSHALDLCDTSQKNIFLLHINFPRKLSDFIIPL